MSIDSAAIEAIEAQAIRELHEAVPDMLRRALGLRLEEAGSALCSASSGEPSILINRCIGLGLGQPASREDIETIISLYSTTGVAEFFLHLTPDARPAYLREWLVAAGLGQDRGWMKFTRDVSSPPEPRSDLQVRRIGPEHADEFARIAANGFDLLESGRALLAGMINAPNWHLFMSFDGDTPAGTGAMYIDRGLAYFDWAATDPAFRRRGSQTALLCHRISEAARLGCRLLVTETGEAVPGDPQHSYHNLQRVGFREVFLRENWSPARPAQS